MSVLETLQEWFQHGIEDGIEHVGGQGVLRRSQLFVCASAVHSGTPEKEKKKGM